MIGNRASARDGAICILPAALIAFLSVAPPAGAQAAERWVGNRVVPRFSDFQLANSEKAAGRHRAATLIYRVERAEGATLRLKAEIGGLRGSAVADQVVPLDQASDFFTGACAITLKTPSSS